MRFTVHAEHDRGSVERGFARAFEAIREAWRLMAEGAVGVHIVDNNTKEVFAPERFFELHR
jgi:2-methylisocitrate lyase-like PEP mutase family enzyme